MDPSTRREIDQHVADALGLRTEDLHRPQVLVHRSPRSDRAIDLYRIGAVCLVLAPDEDLERLRVETAGLAPDEAFTRTVAARLAAPDSTVLGPSWHGYVDGTSFRGRRDERVVRVDRDDDRLAALRDACAPEDWSEGGFAVDPAATDADTTPLYGLVEDDGLAAAGNMTAWRGAPGDVGLVTHPDRRREGLGRAVAATMVDDWLPAQGVIRYRALATNAASLAVAAALGFEGYGANILVRRR